jgi:hypothetical protein
MLNDIKSRLGANFKTGDDAVLQDIIDDMTIVAADATNRLATDTKLNPYIKSASTSAYLRRGDEGSKSSNEGSLGVSYIDIEEKLRNDLIRNGLRLVI